MRHLPYPLLGLFLALSSTGAALAGEQYYPLDKGSAPYAVAPSAQGAVWYAQDDALVHVEPLDGSTERLPAPEGTKALRGIGADSIGRLWASDSGGARLYRYDPSDASWQSWPLPDSQARPDSLRVDAMDRVWLHDAASGALLRFDSEQATFRVLPSDRPAPGNALLGGRPGETWSAEPAADRLRVVRD
ncbi:Vgb family protein [Pseudomonas aeruginosa]|uniref:Vgb family protein n=1 Tax=Pseudomonas aeruginosa TaxID=287 RepID=UPI00053DA677|nr:hypothetical protein [Pseudomonas aeruginosa]MBG6736602.1 hypothetical protein [Pseudomonas aeruginosa]NPX14955.1 hypothetical protein [Pseudomonas aeruginosa]HBO9107473.1 hypothetical protein [Pseudomonas aeruginosa]HDY6448468.1 hypothetical protein [Pseudomonas aeruginosa]